MKLWSDIALQAPMWLLLLEIIPVIIIYRMQKRKAMGTIAMDVPVIPASLPVSKRARFAKWVEPLFWTAITLFIIALARPQREYAEEIVKGEGIDIFLVMDLSSSRLINEPNFWRKTPDEIGG